MCGIAGIIIRQQDRGEEGHSAMMERLHRMTESIKHRGPDGEGYWVNENATTGLGHRRLSIIDLSESASQPMHFHPSGNHLSRQEVFNPRYSIIHNGEIYNYIELRQELKDNGYSFSSQSDTEVILAAYDCWKDECVDHFDGMFAFAIWDEQEKELFAARDRLGEKPFFYALNEKQLVFASEIKALWAAGIERRPNRQMLFNFITIGYAGNPNQPDETFFEAIQKLPAATTLRYSTRNHELTFEKYWDIDPEELDTTISEDEALEKFSLLFETSIKRRLRSDVMLGTSLSGGLDSSSVVAIMKRTLGENILSRERSSLQDQQGSHAFTAVFPGYEKDEFAYASAVAGRFGLQHHTVAVSVESLFNDWTSFCRHQEHPVGSASAYIQYKVYELAKEKDVKVLLDGQGADETLAGYHRYYKWFWQELFHHRKLFSSHELRAARKNGVQEKFGMKNVIASLFPELASVILERQYLLHALRQEDLDKEFVRLQSKEAYYTTPALFDLNGVLYFNTCIQGLEELLRYADRNSMAHGRETRLPFLSHELLEFVFSLPSRFKIREGWTKWILRKSMEKTLPESTTWRKDKIGYEPPQAEWMKNSRLQDMVHEARKKMVDEKILKRGVLDKPVRVLDSHAADNYDWRYLSAASSLFGLT